MTLRRWRLLLGGAGILLVLFGAFRLLTQVPLVDVAVLAGWLVAAVIIHDGVLSPLVLVVGGLLTRVPPRARRFVQFALVSGALLAVVGLVLVARQGTQPRAKALLLRHYGANLLLLLTILAVLTVFGYALQVVRDGRARTDADPDGSS